MPHIQIDYSANLESQVLGQSLVDAVHQAAVDSGIFPVWGIRTFARAVTLYRIGNGAPDNGFVNITVRIAPGRPVALRQRITRELFAAVLRIVDERFTRQRLGCQLEVLEFDPNVVIYQNNLANSSDPAEPVLCRTP